MSGMFADSELIVDMSNYPDDMTHADAYFLPCPFAT
jgi:hypothetical protein